MTDRAVECSPIPDFDAYEGATYEKLWQIRCERAGHRPTRHCSGLSRPLLLLKALQSLAGLVRPVAIMFPERFLLRTFLRSFCCL